MIQRLLCCAALLIFASASTAQQPPPWRDDFIDQIVGAWKIEGNVMGRSAHHTLTAEWVLNHHFLQLHEKTGSDAPSTEPVYDAIWFLGYDDVSHCYVLHLLDVFGGRFSETLGYGSRNGNDLKFVFEYPDGPFHNRWQWLPDSKTWTWHLEQKDKDGKWKPFADLKLTRVQP
jgi:hypothetical protein